MKLYKVYQENIDKSDGLDIDLLSFGIYILKYFVFINDYDEVCKVLDCSLDEFKKIKNIDHMYRPYFDYNFCTTCNVRPSDDELFLNYYIGSDMIENHFDWIHDKNYVFNENLKHWCIKQKSGLVLKTLYKSYAKFEPYLDDETKDLYKQAILCKDYNFWCTGGHYTSGIGKFD